MAPFSTCLGRFGYTRGALAPRCFRSRSSSSSRTRPTACRDAPGGSVSATMWSWWIRARPTAPRGCGGPRRPGDLQPVAGYGPQKRFAEDQCRQPWLLNLDADEVVPPDLAAEIGALFAKGEPARQAYRIASPRSFPAKAPIHAYALARSGSTGRTRAAIRPSVHDRVDLKPGTRVGPSRVYPSQVRPLARRPDRQAQPLLDQQAYDLDERGVSIPTWRVFVEFRGLHQGLLGRRHAVRGAMASSRP